MTQEKALLKPAGRLLGIAESGIMGASQSILGGIVLRRDLIIDGVIWDYVTIRGTDSTDTILQMIEQLGRTDINGIMLHGTIIAGYNIIDMVHLHQATKLPIISVTKEPQEDLKTHLQSTFPSDCESRWQTALQNGEIRSIELSSNSRIYVQTKGCEFTLVKKVVKHFTHFGSIPEPIRVARLFARAIAEKEKPRED